MNTTLLHLSLIPGIGPSTIEKLIQTISYQDFDQIFYLSAAEIFQRTHIPLSFAEKIVNGLRDKVLLEKELQLIEKYNVNWTTIISPDYPVFLREIALPPVVLYWYGKFCGNATETIAFVGSRKASSYGQEVINYLVPELVKNSLIIVSGGALGIDTFAHQAALKAQGVTWAVLGSGLLKPYPFANKKLFEAIAEQGALISSFPLTTPPAAGNFPSRNRIISGLSRACVVVQAAEKSGALITARYALEQGKEVAAVPGSILEPLSAGCNSLIKEGALAVTSASSLLELYGVTPKTVDVKEAHKLEQPAQPLLPDVSMLTIEDKVLLCCSTPRSFDELQLQLNDQEADLLSILFNLQLEGKIEQNFMGLWQTVK